MGDIPKTSIRLRDYAKQGLTMEQILERENGLAEEYALRFFADVDNDLFVNRFLTSYYDRNRIDADKVMIITDTHLGGRYGDYNLVKWAYECAMQRGITHILHLGDIIEGFCNKYIVLETKNPELQVEELMERYPRINGITTHYILGNHDYLSNKDYDRNKYYDIYLVKNALDKITGFHYMGAFNTYVNLFGKRRFRLYHTHRHGLVFPNIDSDFTLQGHTHIYSFYEQERLLVLPGLKKLDLNNYNGAGFTILNLEDDNYCFQTFTLDSKCNIHEDVKRLTFKR